MVQEYNIIHVLNANECTLGNGYDGKFHYMFILPQEKLGFNNQINLTKKSIQHKTQEV